MKIILTGGTGFLGTIIKDQFKNEDLITVGRRDSDIKTDLTKLIPHLPASDLVIHAAAKAHSIPKSLEKRKEFHTTNVVGTQVLLESLECSQLPKKFVFISSIAVYGLISGESIDEGHSLDATDPYGGSKIVAEKIVGDWCTKNNIICTILRLPLIAGSNPPGNLKTMIKGIRKGYYCNIGGGGARKSMVLGEDIAKHILAVSEVGGTYNLTDGYHPNFQELSHHIANQLNKKNIPNIPLSIAKLIAKTGDLFGERAPINTNKLHKLTATLTFDDSKARRAFGWNPTPVLKGFKIF